MSFMLITALLHGCMIRKRKEKEMRQLIVILLVGSLGVSITARLLQGEKIIRPVSRTDAAEVQKVKSTPTPTYIIPSTPVITPCPPFVDKDCFTDKRLRTQ